MNGETSDRPLADRHQSFAATPADPVLGVAVTEKQMRSTDEAAARTDLCLAIFRRRVSDLGMAISADERISEHDAATLLEIHRDTLRRWRAEGTGPDSYAIGVGKSQFSYRLWDLARHVEKRHGSGLIVHERARKVEQKA